MTIAARTGFIGLVTNVACTQAPAGGLREAENVVLRMPGCLEPREGVSLLETAGNTPAYGFSLPDTDVYVRNTGSAFAWKEVGGGGIQYLDPFLGSIDPQPFRRDVWCHTQSRGNTYIAYEGGALKFSGDGSAFEMSGLPPYAFFYAYPAASGAGTAWLPDTMSVAYRIVTKHTDDNGVVIRSIPSGAYSFTNSTGGDIAVSLSIGYNISFTGLFEEIEIYRTRNFAAGVAIDDEMQLVGTLSPDGFSVVGAVALGGFIDSTPLAGRGATLYTSPSRGGINQRNDRPPAAATVSAYKGSVFFGNVRTQQRIAVSVNTTPGLTISGATGVGLRQMTGDVTNGSPTILNLSSVAGLEKGQIYFGASDFPDGTYITNIVGTTVTMSAAFTGVTAVGASMYFDDAVKIDGSWMGVSEIAYNLNRLGTATQFVYFVTPPEGGYTHTMVFETISRKAGGATIQATHGDEYNPPLPDYDGTPMAYDQQTLPGVVFWSKKDEPEHVAPGSYAFVGDKGKAILGLVPTRDALFILKEDGVFRLTGSGATEGIASPWRIDPYDPTTFCILPSSVKPLNGRCYFLSQRGVVAFGDGGAELVSLPVNDKWRGVIDYIRSNFASTGYYELDGVIGSTAAVFARESEYLIMRGDTEWPLMYNENTRAWTEWRYHSDSSQTYAYSALFSFDRVGRVIHALDSAMYQTIISTDSQPTDSSQTMLQRHDGYAAVTVSSWDASTGALTLSAPVSCLQDDVVEDDAGKLWRVTNDVNGSVTVYVDGLTVYPYGGAMSFDTGACVLYRSLRCRVAGSAFYGEPYESKCHNRVSAMFSRLQGPVALRFAFASQLTPLTISNAPVGHEDWEVESAIEFPLLNGAANYVNGFSGDAVVSNNHARGWLLNVGVRWVQTHGYAMLEGIYLDTRPMRGGDQQVSA